MTDVFLALWLICCFLNLGFSFATLSEGSIGSSILSLLLIPFGPITVAYQWANFHTAQNTNMVLLADVIINQTSRIVGDNDDGQVE